MAKSIRDFQWHRFIKWLRHKKLYLKMCMACVENIFDYIEVL